MPKSLKVAVTVLINGFCLVWLISMLINGKYAELLVLSLGANALLFGTLIMLWRYEFNTGHRFFASREEKQRDHATLG